MAMGSSAYDGSSGHADATAARVRGELLATLQRGTTHEERGRTTARLDQILGPLAGLLIAKWAGYHESEREAIAAFNEEAFTTELPQALKLSAWDRSTERHASEVAAALGEMTANSATGNAAARYVARVAPLVTQATESSQRTYERLHAWVSRLDLGTPEGRALAARLFDDALRTVMATQGRLARGVRHTAAMLLLSCSSWRAPNPATESMTPVSGSASCSSARRADFARRLGPRHPANGSMSSMPGSSVSRSTRCPTRSDLCRTLLAGIDGPGLELTRCTREAAVPETAPGMASTVFSPRRLGVHERHALPLASFRFPSRNVGDSVSSARDGESSSRGKSRRRVAGSIAVPTRLRPGGEERRWRRNTASMAVVSLPAGAFAPWTGIAASLVVFRRTARRSTVRFVSISPTAWQAAVQAGDDGLGDGDESGGGRLGIVESGILRR